MPSWTNVYFINTIRNKHVHLQQRNAVSRAAALIRRNDDQSKQQQLTLLAPGAIKPIIIQNIARFYRKSLLSLTHLKLLGSMLWECVKTKRVLYSLPHSSAVCISSPLGTKTLTLRTAQNSDPTAETPFSKPLTYVLVTFLHPSPHFEESVTHFTQRGASSVTRVSASSRQSELVEEAYVTQVCNMFKIIVTRRGRFSHCEKPSLIMSYVIMAVWVTSMR